MKKLLIFALLLSGLNLNAQDFRIVKGDCMPDLDVVVASESGVGKQQAVRSTRPRRLPSIITNWDKDKTYPQLVVLLEFSDTKFTMENPQAFYNDMFNTVGFNQRQGPGCVAEYFKEQSNGLLNMRFDVYGPFQVDAVAQPYTNPDENTRNYGHETFLKGIDLMKAAYPDLNYKQYDWNGDGYVNQVVFIYAGLPGNVGNEECYGHIWPNTGTVVTRTMNDGTKIRDYTSSGEHWPLASKALCGFGTVCHEFTHSLGLPDIYPTSNNAGYSVCDEWDLMDGGNFTNYGWCPPSYTPMEKWLLGWIDFQELTEPTSVIDLPAVSDGGHTYRIKHSDSEWLLLENRQQSGWDRGIPGEGLVIYHVEYDASVWRGNSVNNNKNARRFELVHADNMNYEVWDDYIYDNNLSTYFNDGRLNNRHLSGSPYPFMADGATAPNDSLTDFSTPYAKMNRPNINGSMILGKPITNIRVSDDGLVSFDFMGGDNTTIVDGVVEPASKAAVRYYDLQGRHVSTAYRGLRIVRTADGRIKKTF